MTKKLVGWVLAGVVLAGIIAGGFLAYNRGKEQQGAITIGAVLPMTGELGFFGQGDREALLLFAEQHPDVRFLIEDSKGSPKDGLAAAQKLLAQGVKYFITSLSYVVNTVQPALDEAKAFNMTLSMDTSAQRKSVYAGRLYVSFENEMDALIKRAVKRQSGKVAVLYVNVETMKNAVENYLKPRLAAKGIALYADTYDFGTRDFRNMLSKLEQQKPDMVRILDFGDKLGVIVRQISELKILQDAEIISGIETLLSDYRNFPPDIIARFFFTCPELLLSANNPVVVKYREKYGKEPTFDAMFAYDIADLLVSAIRAEGYDNVEAVIRWISALRTYKGAAAVYEVTPDTGLSPKISWARISSGKIEFIGN